MGYQLPATSAIKKMCYATYVIAVGHMTHERALSPADLFGGKAPVGALIGLLASGANLLEHVQLCCCPAVHCSPSAVFMCLCDCCVLAFLCFWECIK